MTPMDFILLFLSAAVACLAVAAHGWTVQGLGPAALLIAAGVWQFWMQWLRHRSWLRHRDSGFAPGTQHLALSASIGYFLGITGGCVWLWLTLPHR